MKWQQVADQPFDFYFLITKQGLVSNLKNVNSKTILTKLKNCVQYRKTVNDFEQEIGDGNNYYHLYLRDTNKKEAGNGSIVKKYLLTAPSLFSRCSTRASLAVKILAAKLHFCVNNRCSSTWNRLTAILETIKK